MRNDIKIIPKNYKRVHNIDMHTNVLAFLKENGVYCTKYEKNIKWVFECGFMKEIIVSKRNFEK